MSIDGTSGSAFFQVDNYELKLGSLTGNPAYYPVLDANYAIDNETKNGADQRGVKRSRMAMKT